MTENTGTSPSPPEHRKIPQWSKHSPPREMEVEVAGKEPTVAGDSGRDDESTTTATDGTVSYYYTAKGGREGDSTKNREDSKRKGGGGGGSAGETSTPESSECSSSRGGEDGTTSEASQPSLLARLAGKVIPGKDRLVSRFWKEMPKDEKEHWADLPIEKKREFYKCKSRYVTVDKIETWEVTRSKLVPLKKGAAPPPTCEPVPWLDGKISLWRGDITHLEIDAIVNAANTSLLGGAGVDGAIHSAAGHGLLAECETMGGCMTGQTKMTTGYRLPAKYILHTVGPMNRQRSMLESCYKTCLKLVKKNKLRSVAFPCVSTGIYGYPNDDAAEVAITTVKTWLEKHEDLVDRVIFCVFLEKDTKIYRRKLYQHFPPCSSKVQEEALLKARAQQQQAAAAAAGAAGMGDTSETNTPFSGSTMSESVGDKETDVSVSSSMDVESSTAGWTSSCAGSGDGRGGEGNEGGGGAEEGGSASESSVWGEDDATKAKDNEDDSKNNTK